MFVTVFCTGPTRAIRLGAVGAREYRPTSWRNRVGRYTLRALPDDMAVWHTHQTRNPYIRTLLLYIFPKCYVCGFFVRYLSVKWKHFFTITRIVRSAVTIHANSKNSMEIGPKVRKVPLFRSISVQNRRLYNKSVHKRFIVFVTIDPLQTICVCVCVLPNTKCE